MDSFTVAAICSEDDIKTAQGNLSHAPAGFTLDIYGLRRSMFSPACWVFRSTTPQIRKNSRRGSRRGINFSAVLISYFSKGNSPQKKKSLKIRRFQDSSLELLSRFELETSSLPTAKEKIFISFFDCFYSFPFHCNSFPALYK